MADWRTIDSAPKDGTRILLGWETVQGSCGECAEGFWMSDPHRNHWREIGWFCTDDDVLCDHPAQPTH